MIGSLYSNNFDRHGHKIHSKISQFSKQALEKFITNPCDETLEKFAYSYSPGRCLFGYPLSKVCVEACCALSEQRKVAFENKYHGCRRWCVLVAWREYPAQLTLALIEFDAYLESLEE